MAARSLGLTYMQAMRYVVLPQAVRRVIPPLLNDFIGLQKDTAIIGVIGVDRGRVAGAATISTQLLQLHVVPRRGGVLHPDLTIPLARFTDYLIASASSASARRRMSENGGGSFVSVRGRDASASASSRCCSTSTSRWPKHDVVCLIGASGSGKSTLLRCVNLLERVDEGEIVVDGQTAHRREGRRERAAAQDRDRLPGVQPLPAHDRAPERDARAAQGTRPARATAGEAIARELLAADRARGQGARVPRPALGRPAAARRDRARARDGARS